MFCFLSTERLILFYEIKFMNRTFMKIRAEIIFFQFNNKFVKLNQNCQCDGIKNEYEPNN